MPILVSQYWTGEEQDYVTVSAQTKKIDKNLGHAVDS
jgi:hypothetical protein